MSLQQILFTTRLKLFVSIYRSLCCLCNHQYVSMCGNTVISVCVCVQLLSRYAIQTFEFVSNRHPSKNIGKTTKTAKEFAAKISNLFVLYHHHHLDSCWVWIYLYYSRRLWATLARSVINSGINNTIIHPKMFTRKKKNIKK